jgi:hypothetical protein
MTTPLILAVLTLALVSLGFADEGMWLWSLQMCKTRVIKAARSVLCFCL